jgi:4-amino-4-deoxy-L-arabinose transferase-like glycosyltransferase
MPKVPFWVFILIAVLYFTAIRVDTMDIDASQYAEISREMMKSGDYLHVFDRGKDYLDKPPMLFWVSAASMKVFGVNNFGYKLPSVLFALLGLFATYRLSRRLYGEATGRMAALILATCQGMFLMTNDIRCDTILMSCVITAIWLISEWQHQRKLIWLLGGAAFIALGMMTKGPIALMVPVFCFISDWALKRQWNNFLRAEYILALVVIGIMLIPMSIGLYQQFDLHPEKIVDAKQGVSGLRFFYWSQSFGRITGESPWKNDVDLSFLLLNMLWSFLPWIFLFIPAVIVNVVQLVRQRFRLQSGQEWLTTGGFLITYLALGSSAYQLPHYIFVAFPLASIIVARFIAQLVAEGSYKGLFRVMKPFFFVLSLLLLLITLLLITFVFPAHFLYVVLWVAGFGIWVYMVLRKSLPAKLFWLPAAGMIIINVFLTNHVYYTLLGYQVGSHEGTYIYTHHIPEGSTVFYKMEDPLNSINFYARQSLTGIDSLSSARGRQYLLTMDRGLEDVKKAGIPFTMQDQGQLFKVSELTPEFLNPATRSKVTRNYYLLKLN